MDSHIQKQGNVVGENVYIILHTTVKMLQRISIYLNPSIYLSISLSEESDGPTIAADALTQLLSLYFYRHLIIIAAVTVILIISSTPLLLCCRLDGLASDHKRFPVAAATGSTSAIARGVISVIAIRTINVAIARASSVAASTSRGRLLGVIVTPRRVVVTPPPLLLHCG